MPLKQPHQAKYPHWAGVWSLADTPLSIGRVLTFVEELLLVQVQQNLPKAIDLVFYGDLDLPIVKDAMAKGWSSVELNSDDSCSIAALALLFDLEPIESIWWADRQTLEEQRLRNYEFIWPDLKTKSKILYDSTLNIQEGFRNHHEIPILRCKSQARKRAWDLYRKLIPGYCPVVVHLKNNPQRPGESNADLAVWAEFFRTVQQSRDVRFVLIGNEDPGETIRQLDSVIVTQDYGIDLGRDLALMEMSYLFLGMASGPCNFAIYNDFPYVIFKNPDHHREEMQVELGMSDRFNFAKPFQKILRIRETSRGLIRGWESLVPYLTENDWQQRLKRFHYQRG